MNCAFCQKEAIGFKGLNDGYIFVCIFHWNICDSTLLEKLEEG
jgi:hypothetical protein